VGDLQLLKMVGKRRLSVPEWHKGFQSFGRLCFSSDLYGWRQSDILHNGVMAFSLGGAVKGAAEPYLPVM